MPDAVLVGGTAAALHAGHRFSDDADPVLSDLSGHFDEILSQLESVAGWKTARVKRPAQILGSLDGINTGIRQLIRQDPLETTRARSHGQTIVVPTLGEILRIKGALILNRNATRHYIDFAAMADHLGEGAIGRALRRFDSFYPQPNGESALHQLQIQLAEPMPFDLDETNLKEYKNLDSRWSEWSSIKKTCTQVSIILFDHIVGNEMERPVPDNPE